MKMATGKIYIPEHPPSPIFAQATASFIASMSLADKASGQGSYGHWHQAHPRKGVRGMSRSMSLASCLEYEQLHTIKSFAYLVDYFTNSLRLLSGGIQKLGV